MEPPRPPPLPRAALAAPTTASSGLLILDDPPAVVIDLGSCSCKAGFAGDDMPRGWCTPCISKPRPDTTDTLGILVGDRAVSQPKWRRDQIFCLKEGRIPNWDHIELLYQLLYKEELRVRASDQPVLLSEQLVVPGEQRGKHAELFFEKFRVPAFFCSSPAPLALYAAGRLTGLVLDCGNSFSAAVPVYEGVPLWRACKESLIGGNDLTKNVFSVTSHFGWLSPERYLARDIKEKCCYLEGRAFNVDDHKGWRVTLPDPIPQDSYLSLLPRDIRTHMNKFTGVRRYELPDGQWIELGWEARNIPEPLFRPSLLGLDLTRSMTELVAQALRDVSYLEEPFYKDIVLCGGASLTSGFDTRLRNELLPEFPKAKLIACPERKYLPWIGGSILASLSTFGPCYVTRSEWEEDGPRVVMRKCFA